ncbi:MAG: ABC transporter permease [Bacilli bacterium]
MQKSVLIVLLAALSLLSVTVGVHELDWLSVTEWSETDWNVLLYSRLPRALSIVVCGFGMSIAGLVMQHLSHNRFVSPSTATTVDAAKLGVLVSLVLFTEATTMQKMLLAFLFAILGTLLFLRLLKRLRFRDAIFIPLVGLMLGNVISSITSFFAFRFDLVQNLNGWLEGDFSLVTKGNYELLYLTIPLVGVCALFANKFTVAGLGEEMAKNLGVHYDRIVTLGLVIVALVSASVVISVGAIPFVSLIIPNLVTMRRGDHLRNSLWETGLLGAVFLLACDLLGRIVIFPYEVSISVMVGFIGGAIFLWMLLSERRKTHA